MRSARYWWILALAAALLVVGGCTDNNLDESDADVILEIIGASTPPVTGQADTGMCSLSDTPCLSAFDCPDNETCDLPFDPEDCTIQDWNFQFRNEPLNEGGDAEPYNDVVVEGLTVQYFDSGGGVYAPNRIIPLGIVIPAAGTGSVTFPPIALDDITTDNTTVTLVFSFVARTVTGLTVTVEGGNGALLTIEDCLP